VLTNHQPPTTNHQPPTTNHTIVRMCHSLRELNASGKALTPRGIASACDMLRHNKGITSLAVGDAALGDEGLAALLPGLTCNAVVETLDVTFKGLTPACEVTLAGIASAPASAVKHLALSRNAIGDDGARGLFRGLTARVSAADGGGGCACPLETLLLADCKLTAAAAAYASACLPALIRLTTLVLSSNELGEAGGVALAEALRADGCRIELLELNACSLGGGGTDAIAAAAAQCSSLRKLHLADNAIPSESLEPLCAMIASKAGGFAALTLRGNPGVGGDGGGQRLAAAVQRAGESGAAMGSLDLGRCGVVPADVPPMLAVATLEELHINCNDLSGGLPLRACQLGADPALGKGWLRRAVALRVLDMSGSELPDEDCLLLLAELASDSTALPALCMLGLGGGDKDDRGAWETAVLELKGARDGVMVAWA
jgi:Ran GTPase-activating protein (RanGAP) involved in mRNA processing and transport